jgi:hypothetical protein
MINTMTFKIERNSFLILMLWQKQKETTNN